MAELCHIYTFDEAWKAVERYLNGDGLKCERNGEKSQLDESKRRWCWFDLEYGIGVNVLEQDRHGEILVALFDKDGALGTTSSNYFSYLNATIRRAREKAIISKLESARCKQRLWANAALRSIRNLSSKHTRRHQDLSDLLEDIQVEANKGLENIRKVEATL